MKRWIDVWIFTHIGDICDTNGLLHFKKKEEKLNTTNIFHEYKLVLYSIPKLIDGKIVSTNCRSQLAKK